MSRVLKAMVALLAIAAIAAPAMAEDRLGLSGAMEVRGWYLDDGGDKTETFADQRLRIGGKLSIAEGVSATFRTDFSESDEWGNDAAYGRQNIHVDRAHLDITKGMFSLRAGQQNFAFANSTVDAQDNGILIGINGMMPIQLGYMLTESNGGKASADSHILYASISHKTDAYSVTVYGANETSDVAFKNDAAMLKAARNNAYLNGYTAEDGTKTKGYNQVYSPATGVDVAASETQGDTALAAFDAENDITDYEDGNLATIKGEDVYVVGLTSSYNLGAVKLDVDLAHFFGDFVKSENIDVMGTQLMLNGSVAASEAVTVGA
ncbi:MAG TPA: hypothetical protein VIR78_10255, partial [Malonomonas sp.]